VNLTQTYDADNKVVSRTLNGTTRYFIYDGWSLIAEYNSTGDLVKRYVHGAGIDEILVQTQGSTDAFYHQDALGSTVLLTNASGNIVRSYEYDVFGQVSNPPSVDDIFSTHPYANRFLYTGREFLKEANLYDYRNRVYSPDLGRFLQTDPIRFDAGDVNLYRYVSNNPVNYVDPLGLEDLNLFNNGFLGIGREPLRKYVTRAPDDKKTYTVGGHGNESSILDGNRNRTMTPKELADKIRKDPEFKNADKVVLYSCSTGKGSNSFAEQLAKELGKPVTAPNDILWMRPDGSYLVAPPINPGVPVNEWKPDMSRVGSMVTFP
jgi:RHS repeat-associated protein